MSSPAPRRARARAPLALCLALRLERFSSLSGRTAAGFERLDGRPPPFSPPTGARAEAAPGGDPFAMLRRNARLRNEYLYRKSLEGKERDLYEKKRKIRVALQGVSHASRARGGGG